MEGNSCRRLKHLGIFTSIARLRRIDGRFFLPGNLRLVSIAAAISSAIYHDSAYRNQLTTDAATADRGGDDPYKHTYRSNVTALPGMT